jgi:hypothetical protein
LINLTEAKEENLSLLSFAGSQKCLETRRSIAKIFKDAGFKSSRGKQFSAQTVRQLKDLMEKSTY